MKRDRILIGILLFLWLAGGPAAVLDKGDQARALSLDGAAKAEAQLSGGTAPRGIPPPGPPPTHIKANPPLFRPPPISQAPILPSLNWMTPNVPGAAPPVPGSVPPSVPSMPQSTALRLVPLPFVPAPAPLAPASAPLSL